MGVRFSRTEKRTVPGGAARYFLTDQVDSVHVVTDDSGAAISRMEYLPYGEVWFEEKAPNINENHAPKYNSQEMDKESGLYFFNARHYDPEVARFVTADTVIDGESSVFGYNRYMYVHGNPIEFKDPTGNWRSPTMRSRVRTRERSKSVLDKLEIEKANFEEKGFKVKQDVKDKTRSASSFTRRIQSRTGKIYQVSVESARRKATITESEVTTRLRKAGKLRAGFREKSNVITYDRAGGNIKLKIKEIGSKRGHHRDLKDEKEEGVDLQELVDETIPAYNNIKSKNDFFKHDREEIEQSRTRFRQADPKGLGLKSRDTARVKLKHLRSRKAQRLLR